MYKLKLSAIALIGVLSFSAANRVAAETLIYNDTAANAATSRGAGDAPLASVTSTSAQTITRFEITDQLSAAGDLKFVIFDEHTGTLLYNSGAIAFGADSAETVKSSPVISFSMLPGVLYGFGAIGDVALQQGYDYPPTFYSSNGITASANGNMSDFANPTYTFIASAEIPLNLYTNGTAAATPLPSTAYAGLGLFGGLALMFLAPRIRRAAAI